MTNLDQVKERAYRLQEAQDSHMEKLNVHINRNGIDITRGVITVILHRNTESGNISIERF